MKSQKLTLVTGGAGFIGSNLVKGLNQMGNNKIVICDRLGKTEKWKNLLSCDYIDYIESANLIENLRQNKDFLNSFETIYHLGACSSTTETNSSYLVQNNYKFSQLLHEASMSANCRFIYASSAATYGNGDLGMCDQITDTSKLKPLNMYGYSKQMFDNYLTKVKGFKKTVGLKYFNIFGPNEFHKGEMRSVVAKATDEILKTGKINLFKSYREEIKDGMQKRDFLFVDDAVKMTIHLGENKESYGLYNIGSGRASTWNDLATCIFHALSKEVRINYTEMPKNIKNSYQYYTCANIEKLRSTGYTQEITTLKDAVNKYVKNNLINVLN
jgi:ADP-L-glycero-D-manno-heptose 6-epimerase